jgi:hypothetical protein
MDASGHFDGGAPAPPPPPADLRLSSDADAEAEPADDGVPVFVMLPLDTVNADGAFRFAGQRWFGAALAELRATGIRGVAVDVWWGGVERRPRRYDWAGYRALFDLLRGLGLRVQVVLAFHACGGNVGDDAAVPLPPWVLAAGERDPDVFFTDRPRGASPGRRNRECVTLFADDEPGLLRGRSPLQCYADFMRAFRDEFAADLGGLIEEVVVGAGPCGELRYPSYPETNGWRFPGVGEFQCHDRRALASLARAAGAAGRPEWGAPPGDAGAYNSAPEEAGFFRAWGGTWDTGYGQFFLAWYAGALLEHGERMLAAAEAVFNVRRSATPSPTGGGGGGDAAAAGVRRMSLGDLNAVAAAPFVAAFPAPPPASFGGAGSEGSLEPASGPGSLAPSPALPFEGLAAAAGDAPAPLARPGSSFSLRSSSVSEGLDQLGEWAWPQPAGAAVSLTLKIAGVHWWYRTRSHAAELTAGYFNCDSSLAGPRDGYAPIAALCARHGAALTLTCVEMCDAQHPPEALCSPEGLLRQAREAALAVGVPVAGENALPCFMPNAVDEVALQRVLYNTQPWGTPLQQSAAEAEEAAAIAPGSPPAELRVPRADGGEPGGGERPPRLPAMSAFTFLRLTPEMMTPEYQEQWRRFVRLMRRNRLRFKSSALWKQNLGFR